MMEEIKRTHAPEDHVNLNVEPLFGIIQNIFLVPLASPEFFKEVEGYMRSLEEKANEETYKEIIEEVTSIIYSFSCEMSCSCTGSTIQDPHKTTKKILEKLSTYEWDAKVVVAFVAFLMCYGEIWLVAQLYETKELPDNLKNVQLRLPAKIDRNYEFVKPKYQAIVKLIQAKIKSTKFVMEMKETTHVLKISDLMTKTVYWTIRSMLASAPLIMALISMNYEDIGSSSTTGVSNVSSLDDKIGNKYKKLEDEVVSCEEQNNSIAQEYEKMVLGFLNRDTDDNSKTARVMLSSGHLHDPKNIEGEFKLYGPWGNKKTPNWDLKLAPGESIREIHISCGWIVDRIDFVIEDSSGGKTTKSFGGKDGGLRKIHLEPKEEITKISGISGVYGDDSDRHIIEITISTNLHAHGPFGMAQGCSNHQDFSFSLPPGSSVAGFCGRAGRFFDSIGIYLRMELEKHGPWGSPYAATNCELRLAPHEIIRNVHIWHGTIIQRIDFDIEDTHARTTRTTGLGSSEPRETFEDTSIPLAPNERITNISGEYGVHSISSQCHVAEISIYTNLHPDGYGPFGKAETCTDRHQFSSSVPPDSSIVGFFGRYGQFIDSIGVYVRKVKVEELRDRVVLLLVSDLQVGIDHQLRGLSIFWEKVLLEKASLEASDNLHGQFKYTTKAVIVWVPIVDRTIPWTKENDQQFTNLVYKMPWLSAVHPLTISPVIIQGYIMKVCKFNNKDPLIITLNDKGNIVNTNALHLINLVPSSKAFPCSDQEEQAFWKRYNDIYYLLFDSFLVDRYLVGEYICLYGGSEDLGWIKDFTTTLKKTAQATDELPLHMLYVGKSDCKEKIKEINKEIVNQELSDVMPEDFSYFWERIKSMWYSKCKLIKVEINDNPVTIEPLMRNIGKILSFDASNNGWAVISFKHELAVGFEHNTVVVQARGDKFLTCLREINIDDGGDQLKKEIDKQEGFLPLLANHLRQVSQSQSRCYNHLIFPGKKKILLKDQENVDCDECGRHNSMQSVRMYHCCNKSNHNHAEQKVLPL